MDNNRFRSPSQPPLAEQEELLQLLLQEEGLVAPRQQIQPVSREGDLPVSFAQQRLWFLDQWKPGNPAYTIPLALDLRGALSVELLQECLSQLVARHESLRTSFTTKDGQPFQVIAPVAPFALPYQDLSDMPLQQREQLVQRLSQQENLRPFDLSRGPLLRVLLVRSGPQQNRLLLNMHHIISDGWSFNVLVQELVELYSALAQGRPSPLLPLPIQYADFACWQRHWLAGDALRPQMDYWRQQLEGVAPLELAPDHTRPAQQTFAGAHPVLSLPPALIQDLKELSRREKVSLFTLLLAGVQVLLMRYSGQQDIVVGTPIANRTRSETAGLIGYFVNTLVLRTNLSGNPPFRQLLHRVRQVLQEAHAHQDIPFEQVVEMLQPERDLSRTPLFQVMVTHQTLPSALKMAETITLDVLFPESPTAKYDLTLLMIEDTENVQVFFEYNTDLFEAATIERMMAHWQTLLEGIVLSPAQRLADLPMLSTAQRHQLLVSYNQTQRVLPSLWVHQLVEAQAMRTPQALAVSDAQQQLSYRELNERANQLAHYLRELGVGPEVLVGICLERSVQMLIGLLAILKAGGAYVPLDPNYPQERLALMLADSHVGVLLTQQHLLARLPSQQAQVVCLDRDEARIATYSTAAPVIVVDGEHPAYVIYTSGSTGQPKGVQIVHRALINVLLAMSREAGISPQDRLLAVTTLSFDIAAIELYLPLITGAQILLVSREVAADGVALAQQIQARSATIMQATPATWRLLLDAGWMGDPGLKIISTGEALPQQLASQLLPRASEVWNMYGPTETTIWSLGERIRSADEVISIGTPLANTQGYVLDSFLQPVPPGAVGELYLAGMGLARGYLQRADLTAERFLPNPFSQQPGARMYRTGDLVRYLPDGRVHCLGRLDTQVKLRGFRIELGEIEMTLARHPAVQQCAVLVREDVPGDQRLVAYLVSQEQAVPAEKDLRAFLKETLPDYMLPTAFVNLEQLPLTPNGKLDRQSLLSISPTQTRQEHEFDAPYTPLEQVLAETWKKILRIESIHMSDNFFDLGGHSTLATQLIFRVSKDFQMKLSPQFVFEYSTLAEFTEALLARESIAGSVTEIAEMLQKAHAMTESVPKN